MPPVASETQQSCAICNKLTAKKCSRCMTTFYCSEEHQKQAWKRHKLACLPPAKALSDIVKTRSQAERDGDSKFVVDAILLPWDSDTPRFVKVVCEMYTHPDDEYSLGFQHRALLDPFLGAGQFHGSVDLRTATGYDGPPLGYTLMLRWQDMFLNNGSPLNRCVVKITDGKAYHPWGGNLIAYRVDEPVSMVARCKDSKAEDLAVLTAYLVEYGKRVRAMGG
ncbi:hypothetical protein R3P38DRAFT_2958206 [Favolaschia claudopus]|uniref:MYND-type domain-containing protein n=1 Tax=Favolaschia claudopus TaxID=2862362 RepID=A0AAW0BC09_9AGAR